MNKEFNVTMDHTEDGKTFTVVISAKTPLSSDDILDGLEHIHAQVIDQTKEFIEEMQNAKASH